MKRILAVIFVCLGIGGPFIWSLRKRNQIHSFLKSHRPA
jgi:hypothetical protein